jgi:hypothetical protein
VGLRAGRVSVSSLTRGFYWRVSLRKPRYIPVSTTASDLINPIDSLGDWQNRQDRQDRQKGQKRQKRQKRQKLILMQDRTGPPLFIFDSRSPIHHPDR